LNRKIGLREVQLAREPSGDGIAMCIPAAVITSRPVRIRSRVEVFQVMPRSDEHLVGSRDVWNGIVQGI
jgi:hypothetical protein